MFAARLLVKKEEKKATTFDETPLHNPFVHQDGSLIRLFETRPIVKKNGVASSHTSHITSNRKNNRSVEQEPPSERSGCDNL